MTPTTVKTKIHNRIRNPNRATVMTSSGKADQPSTRKVSVVVPSWTMSPGLRATAETR